MSRRIRYLLTFGSEFAFADKTSSGYRWWKPLLIFVIAAFANFAVLFVVFLVIAIVGAILLSDTPSSEKEQRVSSAIDDLAERISDEAPWAEHAFLLGSLALLIPMLLVGVAVVRRRGLGSYSSINWKIRWRWLAWSFLPAVSYALILFAGPALIRGASGETNASVASPALSQLVLPIVLIVVLTPFQAGAEEYIFRGFLLQTFAGWFRFPLLGALVSALLFTAGHSYNVWGLMDVFIFAMVVSFVVLRTGGLEAGIVVHVATNVPIGVITLVTTGRMESGSEGGLPELLISVFALLVWAVLTTILYSRLTRADRPRLAAGAGPAQYPVRSPLDNLSVVNCETNEGRV